MTLEAMKMEVNVPSPKGPNECVVRAVKKKPGAIVYAGDALIVLEALSS